jgi:hypothetical protein
VVESHPCTRSAVVTDTKQARALDVLRREARCEQK